jgi:hypothetical protein
MVTPQIFFYNVVFWVKLFMVKDRVMQMTKEELQKKLSIEGLGKSFVYKNYKCEIKRVPEMLHLCGYVSIPKGNKFYEKAKEGYDSLDLSVHGGLTFSELKVSGDIVIGFDCAHFGDLIPGRPFMLSSLIQDEYKDMEYVENQIKKLVDQLDIKTPFLRFINLGEIICLLKKLLLKLIA